MSEPGDGEPPKDASEPVTASGAAATRRGGGFAGPSDSAEAAGARRVERRRTRRRWIAIGVAAVAIAAVVRFTPLLDPLLGRSSPDDLAGIDESEQEGLLVVTEGDVMDGLSISVMKKRWPIPPLAAHDPADPSREPWERATDALAADLKSRGERPWNAHTARELPPPSASLLDAVLARLLQNGVKVIHYPARRRSR